MQNTFFSLCRSPYVKSERIEKMTEELRHSHNLATKS